MNLMDLDYGQAVILPFKEKHKIIIRKERDELYYMAHPITLKNIKLNFSGAYILIQYIESKNKEQIRMNLANILELPYEQVIKWVDDFEIYLKEKRLI